MGRLLFLIAIAALVYLLFRLYRKKLSAKKDDVIEDMVRCAQCGMHLPKGESIRAGGRDFCSEEHRVAYGK